MAEENNKSIRNTRSRGSRARKYLSREKKKS
jgi:hypothetical protein